MYTLILCLFIACLLPYLSRIPVFIAMKKHAGGYNNSEPRVQQASLKGYGARALAAHQNSFESLIIFAAAILTALATQHITPAIQRLAIIYLIVRFAYHGLYLINWAGLRSCVWAVGYIVSMSIIYLCLP